MVKWLKWIDIKDELPPRDPKKPDYSIPVKTQWIGSSGRVYVGSWNRYLYYCFIDKTWRHLNSNKKFTKEVVAWTTDTLYINWKKVSEELPLIDKEAGYCSIVVRVKTSKPTKNTGKKLAFYDYHSKTWVYPNTFNAYKDEIVEWAYLKENKNA